MNISRIHHAQITIPAGTERSARDFYCNVLGLREIEKPASLQARGGFWLQVGEMQVHVGTEAGVDRLKTKAHLAYQVDDVAAWQNTLATHGIEMADSIPIEGYARFEFRDPFGNRVEFIQQLD